MSDVFISVSGHQLNRMLGEKVYIPRINLWLLSHTFHCGVNIDSNRFPLPLVSTKRFPMLSHYW